ncbi:MAG: hypothetical protein ABL993_07830 [Vicinamibacterales bacterium]
MTDFDFTISVPADRRYADTLRALAARAARQAGCAAGEVEAFETEVHDAVLRCLAGASHPDVISVTLRQGATDVEALIDCGRTIRVACHIPNVV